MLLLLGIRITGSSRWHGQTTSLCRFPKSLNGAFNLKWKKSASLDLGLTLIDTAKMYGED